MKPIKAIGARSWLVTSSDDPPQGVVTFNGSPLIIKQLESKAVSATHAIVAGPKPRRQDAPVVNSGAPTDAWAEYLKHNPSPFANQNAQASRPVDGPIEKRFKGQNEKLTTMEQAIAQIKQDQVQLKQAAEQGFQEARARDESTRVFVTKSLDQNKIDIEKAVGKALDNQSGQLTTKLDELKALFINSSKRGCSPDAENMSVG